MRAPVRTAAGCLSSGCWRQGWSVTAAAEAAGVSERTVYRWLRRWRDEGERGLLDRSSAPQRGPATRLARVGVEAIEALRRLRMTAAQIAEVLGYAALDGVGLAEADRARQALPARAAGAAQPLRAPPSRRARPRRHQAARPHLAARRRSPHGRPPQEPGHSPRPRPPARGHRLRIRARDDRRPLAARLRRGARRPRPPAARSPSCAARVAWFAERGVQIER